MILTCYLSVMRLAIPALKAAHLEATSALLQRCWSVCAITPSNTTLQPGKPFRYFIKIIITTSYTDFIFLYVINPKGECFGRILSLYQLIPLPRKHLWCCLYYSYVSPSFNMIGMCFNEKKILHRNHCSSLTTWCRNQNPVELCYPGGPCSGHDTWVHCAH